jgi:sirohydrochlorin ferrochelatase
LVFSSAYLLISHGSRDPRPQLAMAQLAQLVRNKLESQVATRRMAIGDREIRTAGSQGDFDVLVGTATLELGNAPLHEQIQQFARLALSSGGNQIQLLPIFLLPGVHVKEDIPTEVALAQTHCGQGIALHQRPHLGSHPGLRKMLARRLAKGKTDAKILLSHGTRRPGGNQPVEVVAQELSAVAAYWSVPPTLAEQILALKDAGHQQISILPYFLFSGGITDAIAQSVSHLQERFSQIQLNLCHPIGVSSELANLIVDLANC